MELSLTTFLLEIINFVVLLWILKRLLFLPVKNAIEKRKSAVAKTLADAQRMRREAQELQTRYEGRLMEWEEEKSKARQELKENLAEEQSRGLKEMQATIQAAQTKMQAQIDRDAADYRERSEHEAMKYAMQFASRLLGGLASPELETKIVQMTLEHLRSHGRILKPPQAIVEPQEPNIVVRTAFELHESERQELRTLVKPLTRGEPQIEFSTDPRLVAGMEITRGSMVLKANLRDELLFFSEVTSA